MKIIDVIKGDRPSLSFEVFPPKTDDAFEGVLAAATEIAALKPSYMSVTYGAGGGTSQYTKDVCTALSAHGVPALAHLTCYSSDKARIRTELDSLREKGIENVLALRGDKPQGFDVQDIRLGGCLRRLESCRHRLLDYVDGKVDSIPELEGELLPFGPKEESLIFNDVLKNMTCGVMYWGV